MLRWPKCRRSAWTALRTACFAVTVLSLSGCFPGGDDDDDGDVVAGTPPGGGSAGPGTTSEYVTVESPRVALDGNGPAAIVYNEITHRGNGGGFDAQLTFRMTRLDPLRALTPS